MRQGSGPQTIETITVIGTGTVGHGIAQVAGASQDLLRLLEALSDRSFIFASNTSSLGYNHSMGPLKLTHLVGLDVRLNIAEYLHRELGSETFRPPEVLRRMVKEGKLGRKSGEDFYDWHNDKEDARRMHSS